MNFVKLSNVFKAGKWRHHAENSPEVIQRLALNRTNESLLTSTFLHSLKKKHLKSSDHKHSDLHPEPHAMVLNSSLGQNNTPVVS